MAVAKSVAKRHKHAPPRISPEGLLILLEEQKCAICGQELAKRTHLHHDHKTGNVYGFAHAACNQAEGIVAAMPPEQRKNFLFNMWFIFEKGALRVYMP